MVLSRLQAVMAEVMASLSSWLPKTELRLLTRVFRRWAKAARMTEKRNASPQAGVSFLCELERVIDGRKREPQEGSYTSYLFEKGIDKIAKKFGEEAVETVIAAKNDEDQEFVGECADMLYHFLVLLREKNIRLCDVCTLLYKRHE